MRKTKIRRRNRYSRRSKKSRRNKQRLAGNILISNFFNENTPAAQNSYLRKTVSDLIGNIDFESNSGYFTTYWKTIHTFVEKLAYYEMISYPGGHGPPTPTFIEELYENRTKLLKNIEEIEDIHNRYRALRRHGPGTHHHGRTFKKILQPKRPYAITKSFSTKRKLPDIAKAMEKNVLPLTELIKTVIETEIVKRKTP